MLGRLLALFGHPYVDRYIVALALLLTLPSISDEWVFDDYVLGMQVRNPAEIPQLAPGLGGDLFTFTRGEPTRNHALMAQGALLPFWTDPQHLNAFLRPLSSWTHWLDFTWFPRSARLMHVHSWLWFALLLWLARSTFRDIAQEAAQTRAEPQRAHTSGHVAWTAVLPFALFAVDDVHGATLSWISNRNALIAVCCTLPALSAHIRALHLGGWLRLIWGPLWFCLGLAAGETALGVLGYLAAHALVLERDAISRRLLRLAPYGLCLVGWRLLYRAANLGSYGSGGYHDPIREPADFVLALAQNLPILLGSQLSVPYADLAFWGPPDGAGALLSLSIVLLALTAVLALPVLRCDRVARFYALGAVLCAVPVSASVPGQRLLLYVSVGAAGFIAHWLLHLANEIRSQPPERKAHRPFSIWAAVIASALVFLHGPAAAASLPIAARSMTWVGQLADHIGSALPRDAEVRGKTVILVNAPFDVMASYEQVKRAYLGVPRPAHLYWLSTASSELHVERADERSLVITPSRGYLWSPQERHYRREMAGLFAGASVILPGMRAEVLRTLADGRPATVRFEFRTRLEDDDLLFFVYRDGRYEPWSPPRCGRGQHFSEQGFFARLVEQVVSRD